MRIILLLVVVGGAVFFLGTVYSNKFNALKAKIDEARRRLEKHLEAYLNLSKKLQEQISRTENIGRAAAATSLKTAEKAVRTESISETGALINEMGDHFERAAMQLRNPNLAQSSAQILGTVNALEDELRKLKVARRDYNTGARDYNALFNGPPASFVATIMKFERIPLCEGNN